MMRHLGVIVAKKEHFLDMHALLYLYLKMHECNEEEGARGKGEAKIPRVSTELNRRHSTIQEECKSITPLASLKLWKRGLLK